MGQREVGEVTRKVTCTWWLLGLSVKPAWLGLGGPILALAAWTGLENGRIGRRGPGLKKSLIVLMVAILCRPVKISHV